MTAFSCLLSWTNPAHCSPPLPSHIIIINAASSNQASEPICCHKLTNPYVHPVLNLDLITPPWNCPEHWLDTLPTQPIRHRWNGHQWVKGWPIDLEIIQMPSSKQISFAGQTTWVWVKYWHSRACQISWINASALLSFHKLMNVYGQVCVQPLTDHTIGMTRTLVISHRIWWPPPCCHPHESWPFVIVDPPNLSNGYSLKVALISGVLKEAEYIVPCPFQCNVWSVLMTCQLVIHKMRTNCSEWPSV